MTRLLCFALSILALSALAGCSKPADDAEPAPAPVEQAAAAPAPAPAEPAVAEPAPAPAPKTEPEPEAQVAMPEGLPAVIHVYPEIKVTEATAVNAAELHFEIKGETSKSVVQVLNYYAKYFRENGWEEDMLMEHEGNTVVSFHRGDVLQYVDSVEGGPGSYVTITTGKY